MKPKKYTPLDLGYTRTPTSAKLRVRFSNGNTFDVPLQVVADDRDSNYKDEEEDTVQYLKDKDLDMYDVKDWAMNNMNWEDLSPYAVKVKTPPVEFDYEEEYCDAEMDIEGEV